jgi:ureidoglycolate dehydrogenase (NAD+)
VGELRRFTAGVLQVVGVPADDAALAAHIITQGNARGVDTHGVNLLDHYVRRLQRRLTNPTPRMVFEQQRTAAGVLDADLGLGHIAAFRAMEHAVRLARSSGVATVLVRNSNHFGAAAYYTMWAAEQNCIGMVWSPAEAAVVPFGGRTKFFGTNPIAISGPSGNEYPGFTIDMATSVVAGGKLVAAGKFHQTIPVGWAIDQEGRAVTEPAADDRTLLSYALLPMSGAKGYGLATMVEWTASLLPGMPWGPRIVRKMEDRDHPAPIGHYVQAIDVEAFMPLEEYRRSVDEFCAALKNVPPAQGFTEVLLPGEPERRTAERRAREGCPLPAYVVRELSDLAKELGVPMPRAQEGEE